MRYIGTEVPMKYEQCCLCGKDGWVHRRTETGGGVCGTCYRQTKPPELCCLCGEMRRVDKREHGKPICSGCYIKIKPKEICCLCGKTAKVSERLPEGPICDVCYRKRSPYGAWRAFLRGAKQIGRRSRNIEVSITKEEFLGLVFDSVCYYCGGRPQGIRRYLGIDRKDNDVGYFLPNCVPCCWLCNQAKGTMGHDEFVALCRRVVLKHGT